MLIMSITAKHILIFLSSIVIYCIYSKVIDAIHAWRIRLGIDYRIVILITNDKTYLFNEKEGDLIDSEPNIIIYKAKSYFKKIYLLANSGDITKIQRIHRNKSLKQLDFIENYSEVIEDLRLFWGSYITYFVLKAKKINKISHFIIPTVILKIEVTPDEIRNKIRLDLESFKNIKKKKDFNILEISSVEKRAIISQESNN